MIMKNWEDFPYYILSTALTFEKVCLKRQKCTSCCQDRGVDPEQPPWICNSGGQITFTLQNKIITKQQGLRFDKFLQDKSGSQSNLALHACRIKHSHPTPCQGPAGSGSPLGCSLVVTRAKAHPTYTHKPSTNTAAWVRRAIWQEHLWRGNQAAVRVASWQKR